MVIVFQRFEGRGSIPCLIEDNVKILGLKKAKKVATPHHGDFEG